MTDIPVGPSQDGSQPAPPVTGANSTQTQHSDLAAARAHQQRASNVVGATPDSEPTTSSGQGQGQRSEYIPRDRFDEVNARRIAAEAQLQQLTQLTQAQAMRAAQSNAGQAFGQQQQMGQAVANSPQVKGFLDSLSSKEEQDKWRQKILNQPVTGIAELVQYAIQTEGASLLQQELAKVQSTLAPMQQFYVQQQGATVNQYAQRRASDPASGWASVKPVFDQLVTTAQQRGYPINQQSLEVIETVARGQVGLPYYQPAPQAPPFTERPGAGQVTGQAPVPVLTEEQKKYAKMFGIDESKYAADYAEFGRSYR